jgi:hypothetical protein
MHLGLIAKEDIRLLLTCHAVNLGVCLFEPFLYYVSILLKRAPKRLLRAEAELVEQPAHRCPTETNVEFTPDKFGYHKARLSHNLIWFWEIFRQTFNLKDILLQEIQGL